MPPNVKGDRLDGLLVRQIVELLENQGSQRDRQILAGTPESVAKMRSQFTHRQLFQQKVPKYAGPTLLQQMPPPRPQVIPERKENRTVMVAKCAHGSTVAPGQLLATPTTRLFAGPSTFDNISCGDKESCTERNGELKVLFYRH